MKVKQVLMIAAVLLALLVVPVAAEDKSASTSVSLSSAAKYEIVIPPSGVDLNTGIATAKPGIQMTAIAPGSLIELSLASDDNLFKLIHTYDSQYGLDYTVMASGVDVVSGDLILSADAGIITEQNVTLSFTANIDNLPAAGIYKDTLTFTAKEVLPTIVTTVDELRTAITEDKKLIVLGDDITLTSEDVGITIPAGKTITLNLNGHTISQTKTQTAAYALITNKGDLTIVDTSANGAGKITYTDSGNGGEYASNVIRNEGDLTINGGTIVSDSSSIVANNGYPHAIDVYQGSTTVIDGGTIQNDVYTAIRMFCNSDTQETKVVINDGHIINAIDFQNPSTNKAGYGTLIINGGEFSVTQQGGGATKNNLRYLGFSTDDSQMKLTVTGGTFNPQTISTSTQTPRVTAEVINTITTTDSTVSLSFVSP